MIAKMAGSKLAPMIIRSENGETCKFYTLASASKFMGVSMTMMYYAYKNPRVRINRSLESTKYVA